MSSEGHNKAPVLEAFDTLFDSKMAFSRGIGT